MLTTGLEGFGGGGAELQGPPPGTSCKMAAQKVTPVTFLMTLTQRYLTNYL